MREERTNERSRTVLLPSSGKPALGLERGSGREGLAVGGGRGRVGIWGVPTASRPQIKASRLCRAAQGQAAGRPQPRSFYRWPRARQRETGFQSVADRARHEPPHTSSVQTLLASSCHRSSASRRASGEDKMDKTEPGGRGGTADRPPPSQHTTCNPTADGWVWGCSQNGGTRVAAGSGSVTPQNWLFLEEPPSQVSSPTRGSPVARATEGSTLEAPQGWQSGEQPSAQGLW